MHIWIVEIRNSAKEPWQSTTYCGLSRAWARQEQQDARTLFKYTRVKRYIRGVW